MNHLTCSIKKCWTSFPGRGPKWMSNICVINFKLQSHSYWIRMWILLHAYRCIVVCVARTHTQTSRTYMLPSSVCSQNMDVLFCRKTSSLSSRLAELRRRNNFAYPKERARDYTREKKNDDDNRNHTNRLFPWYFACSLCICNGAHHMS